VSTADLFNRLKPQIRIGVQRCLRCARVYGSLADGTLNQVLVQALKRFVIETIKESDFAVAGKPCD